MLLRKFGSLKKYSNQGFEASHTSQRQIYSRATNHDYDTPGSSCKFIDSSIKCEMCLNCSSFFAVEQIPSFLYAEELLTLRYSFRQAKTALTTDESQHLQSTQCTKLINLHTINKGN